MRRALLVLTLATSLVACSGSAVPTVVTESPVFGQPFSVDGYTIQLMTLTTVESLPGGAQSNPGEELYILSVRIENHTGSEQHVGSGFRVQDDSGQIIDGNFVSPIEPQLDATLADGGYTVGNVGFSLTLPHTPTAVLVKPAGTEIVVQVPAGPAAASRQASLMPGSAATSTSIPSPTATPKPTRAPARLVFSSSVNYGSTVCLSNGYGYIPFSLTVTNKGGMASDYIWFKIGSLGAIAGAALSDASWSNGKYVWDDSLFSDSMGYLFVRGPQILPGKAVKLNWKVRTIAVVSSGYSVEVFTGPPTMTNESDLTPTGDSYGPLTTQMQFC